MMLSVPSLKTLPILVPPMALAAIHLFEASDSDNNATGSLPVKLEPGERTLGLGECIFFVPGDRVTLDAPDGVRCSWARARGEDLEGVMVKGVFIEGFEGVLLEWGLGAEDGGTVVGVLSMETVLVREAVSPLPNTDAELEVAELVRTRRTDADEGLFLCFAGLGDVKFMAGLGEATLIEARC
jgi:hypothetical protein